MSEHCHGTTHLFKMDDDETPPETRCLCGDYSWGEMDRIKETFEALEAMWVA